MARRDTGIEHPDGIVFQQQQVVFGCRDESVQFVRPFQRIERVVGDYRSRCHSKGAVSMLAEASRDASHGSGRLIQLVARLLATAERMFRVKRTGAVVFVMVAGICLMLWAGWHNLRERRLALQKAQENHVVIQHDDGSKAEVPAGTTSEAQEEPLKGKPAPAFTLVNLEGKKVSLADYKGRPVIVNFWATWCAPCKLEMPWFQEFRTKYSGQGFEILGIAEDEAPKDEIEKTAKKINVSYPILLTDGKVAPAYGGVDQLPMSFYIDRKGVVVTETVGLASKDEVEANIKKLIAGNGAAATISAVLPSGAGQ